MKRIIFVLITCLTLSACGINPDDAALDKQIAADKARVSKCDEISRNAKKIDEYSTNLVKEAKRLQLVWITEEMRLLRESNKITSQEWDTFYENTKPGINPPRFTGGELDLLMKRVVALGYIEPYLPEDVVKLGTAAAESPSSMDYELNYPECFSEFEYNLKKEIASLEKTKGVWADKVENALELVPWN
jgi:hypothetical protein